MKKFEFELETVHKVREIRKDRQRDVLAAIRQELDEAVLHAKDLDKRCDEIAERNRAQMASGDSLDLATIEMNSKHLADMIHRRNLARDEVAKKEVEIQEQVARL